MGFNLRIQLFSRRQRFCLGLAFTALNVIQVILGILTTCWSIYICLAVSPKLYTEKNEINFVFTVTGLYGTHIIIHYLVGIKICEKCIYKAHKKSTKRHLLFWCLAGCNTILNIIILSIISVKISKHIAKSMRHSLERGMQSYLSAPIWKHTIDTWQFTLQCCGVNDYKDWYDLTWLDKYHIDISSPMVHEMRLAQDRFHFPVTPWSCCRIDFPMQCLHDPFQQVQSAYLWKEQPKLVLESINTAGCLEKLRAPIRWSLIGFTLVCILLVVFHTTIIIISRLLYTSCKNSIILRNPEGEAPGYVLTRFCSGVGSRTVSELVLDLKSKEKSRSDSPLSSPRTIKGCKKKKTGKGKSNRKSPQKGKSKFKKDKKPHRQDRYDSNQDPISSEDEQALMLR